MTRDVGWIEAGARPPRRPIAAPPFGVVTGVWSTTWISLFAFGDWHLAMPMALLTWPVAALGWRWRRAARRSRRALRAPRTSQIGLPAAPASSTAVEDSPAVALDRRVAASVVRAESSGTRLDADALAIVRELAARLQPLLTRVRQPGVDAGVRHDVEAIVRDHLPAVLDAYLGLPTAALRTAVATGASPADTLRAQLLLLSEGARELEQAVVRSDLGRQQQLGRFLDAKFRKSDLEL